MTLQKGELLDIGTISNMIMTGRLHITVNQIVSNKSQTMLGFAKPLGLVNYDVNIQIDIWVQHAVSYSSNFFLIRL